MPENQPAQPDFNLAESQELLWNAVAGFQSIQASQLFIEIALEQLDKQNLAEAIARCRVLLETYRAASAADFGDTRINLYRLWENIKPCNLPEPPAGQIERLHFWERPSTTEPDSAP